LTLKNLENSKLAAFNLLKDLQGEIETRKKTETELRVSESKIRSLFTSMQEGFALHEIICDIKGKPIDYRFLEINPAFEKLTGLKAKELIGKTNLEVLPNSEPYWIDTYGKVALTGKKISFENYSRELGKHYKVSAYSPEPGRFATIFLDISERKKAEELEFKLVMRQKALLGAVPDILMEINKDKIYTWSNKAGYNFFGENVIGKNADFYFMGEHNLSSDFQPLFDGLYESIYFERWQKRKDGEKRLLAWWNNTMKDPNNDIIGVLSSARDITDIKNKEIDLEKSREQLEQMNLYLQKAREEERKLIARDLHDDLGQALTAVKIDLGNLNFFIDDKKKLKTKIEKISSLVNDSIITVQRLTSELRPHVLDDLGLKAAIEWYTAQYIKRTGIKLIHKIDLSIELPREMELVIFRIMQESLTNITRHSKAENVEITFLRNNSEVVLEIKDDGVGISQADIKHVKSFGLLNMNERAREIGGTLVIESGKKSGTIIRLCVPDILYKE
jgi:PAS domain S-box-containing protein